MTAILFFDDWGLHYRDNVERRMGEPEPVPAATLRDPLVDTTWQRPTVWYDADADRWKAIYLGTWPHHTEHDAISFYPPADHWDAVDRDITDKTQVLLYAESPDGIGWHRPDLSAEVEVESRVARNQVFAGGVDLDSDAGAQFEGGPVYVDERDPAAPLKFFYGLTAEAGTEYRLATSTDGKHWADSGIWWSGGEGDAPAFEGVTPVFYDRGREEYVVVHRPAFGDRRVAFTRTPDFEAFGETRLVASPDPEDPPLVEFYTMPVFPYEDRYVGFLWRLHTDPHEVGHKYLGRMDAALTYSRDGTAFNRATHDAFLPPGPPGSATAGGVYPSSMVVRGDEIRIYSGGAATEHFRDQSIGDNAGLVLHRLRKDGFFYLEPPAGRGEVLTRPITLESEDLRLNVEAPRGRVRVAVRSTAGEPLAGLGYSDAVPFRGDATDHRPEWEGAALSAVVGRPVCLGVELTEARLYAIRGEFERHPVAPDKVFDREG